MTNQYNVLNWVKVIGFITMLIDHIGLFLFPDVIALRMIGRFALPCFLYGIVIGVDLTRNPYRYAGRMALMGVAGMMAWGQVMPLNIGFSLAVLIMGLTAYKQENMTLVFLMGILSLFVEYGLYGYLFGFILYLGQTEKLSKRLFAIILISLHFIVYALDPIQVFALGFFLILYFAKKLSGKDVWAPKITKGFGYSFYPIHIGVLNIISVII